MMCRRIENLYPEITVYVADFLRDHEKGNYPWNPLQWKLDDKSGYKKVSLPTDTNSLFIPKYPRIYTQEILLLFDKFR